LLHLLSLLFLSRNFSLLPNTDPQTLRNLLPVPTSKPLHQLFFCVHLSPHFPDKIRGFTSGKISTELQVFW
jgi:hypothetical protein